MILTLLSKEQPSLFSSLRVWLLGIGLFSGVINVLGLTGSFFMLQVYDRVLTSHSVPTLIGLSILAAALYVFQGSLDLLRSRLLVRIGSYIDDLLAGRIYAAVLQLPLRTTVSGDGLQPLRDLDNLRSFLAGQGPVAAFDLPWVPIYLIFVFTLHFWLGCTAVAGALVLVVLTAATEVLSRQASMKATEAAMRSNAMSLAGFRNAEVLRAMGFAERHTERWLAVNRRYRSAQQQVGDVSGGMSTVSKTFRAMLQSALLALGAWLTIKGDVSAGAIVAGSIVSARALAPIEIAIANWRFFLTARESSRRLSMLMEALPVKAAPLQLPPPRHELVIDGVFAGPPGSSGFTVHNVSLKLVAGQGLGLVGPSGSGKSTFVRTVVGAWPLLRGSIRIDGATLDQWDSGQLGRHIGYLPQEIEFFEGTIAENIARLDHGTDVSADVITGAKAANVHDMVLHLPDGYDTIIGRNGSALSAGQRQRLALARALYGDPFLIVLDEPSSNLDAEGEAALSRAIDGVRRRGGIVIVVAHRPSTITSVNLLAVIGNGTLQAFGPKQDVLQKLIKQSAAPRDVTAVAALNASGQI